MFRRVLVAALLVAAGCSHGKYQVKAKPVAYDGYFATYPSGLRLVVVQLPVERFTVSMSYGTGGADDPAGKEGLAHVVEHLAFRARPRGPLEPTIWEWLVASGWRWNASTSFDETTYWEAGPPGELRRALRLEALRLKDPLAGVSEADFTVERDVVRSEHRERFEAEDGEVAELLTAAFKGHAYGRPIAGTPESLSALTLSDARAFARDRYGAAGAVLTVVSPLPPAKVGAMVLEEFEELARNGEVKVAPLATTVPELPARAPAPVTVKAPVERPRVWAAWAVPGPFTKDAPYGPLMAGIVRDSLLDQLEKHWLFENTLAADTGFEAVGGAGVIWARIELDDEQLSPRAADALRAAARELSRYRLPDSIADEYSDGVMVRSFLRLDDLDPRPFARFLRQTGSPDYLRDGVRLAAAQLRTSEFAYSKRWITPERTAVLLVSPDGDTAGRDLGAAATLDARAPEGVAVLAGGHGRTEDEASAIRVPDEEGVLATARPPGLHAAERRTLANGLEVVFAPRARLPIAEVRLVVRTSPAEARATPVAVPALALGHSTAFDTRVARYVGAPASTRHDHEHVVRTVRGSGANLEVLLEAVASWARDRKFGAPQFERSQRFLKRKLAWYRTSGSARAWEAMQERLFPGHAYGARETVEAVAELQPRDASRWLSTALRPDRATLIVVADAPPTPELWAHIEQEFGAWKADGPAAPAVEPPAPPASRSVTVVHRAGASQPLVLVGLRAPPLAERDRAATDAAEWLLRSRLQRKLRVEGGATYGVSSIPIEHERGAAVVVALQAPARSTGAAVRAVLDAAASLATDPLDSAAVERARWRVARDYASRFETVAQKAAALEELAVHEREADAWETEPTYIAALTPARVQTAAQALGVGREAIVVVGDAKLVVPQLEALGLTPEVLK